MKMSVGWNIIADVATQIVGDGFKQVRPGIFIKPLAESWRGWFTIDRGDYQLGLVVGVLSQELQDIRAAALKKIGRRPDWKQSGPPLIMKNLDQVTKQYPDCLARVSWNYTGDVLKPAVADDIVYCLRRAGSQYMEQHADLDAVLDEVVEGRASPGMVFYMPILLLKRNRPDYLAIYVEAHLRRVRSGGTEFDERTAREYAAYVDALREIVVPLPGRWAGPGAEVAPPVPGITLARVVPGASRPDSAGPEDRPKS